MTDLALTTVVKGILTILVVGSLLFFTLTYYPPVKEAMLNLPCKYMGLCQTKEEIQLNAYVNNPRSFDLFTKAYQECKQSTESECLCETSQLYLPANTFMHIENQGLFTQISLCEGTAKSTKNYDCKKLIKEVEIQGEDVISIPPGSQTLLGTEGLYTFDSAGKIQYTEVYSLQATNSIILKQDKMEIQVIADISGPSQRFSLESLYKKDLVNTHFLPPAAYDEAKQTLDKKQVCKTSDGAQDVLSAFEKLRSGIRSCLRFSSEQEYKSDPTVVLLDENTIAIFTYVLPKTGTGHWEKSGPYDVTINDQLQGPLALNTNAEQQQKMESIFESLDDKNALSGLNVLIQQQIHYLTTKEDIAMIHQQVFNNKNYKTSDPVVINDIETQRSTLNEGVCADIVLSIPKDYTINYENNEIVLYEQETPIKRAPVAISLRRASSREASQEQTQVIISYTFDQNTKQVQFTRYLDGSVAMYPYTLEMYLLETQHRAEEVVE